MSAFADLEQAANAAVVDGLANATAVVNGALSVRGIFDRNPQPAFGAVEAAGPRLTVSEADWEAPSRDDDVLIDARAYRVTSVERDGAGMVSVGLAAR